MSEPNNDQLKRASIRAKLEAGGIEVEWTAAEVAAYLACSENLIYDLCHKRQIPHRRIDLPGRERPLFRFRKSEIDKWRDHCSEVVSTTKREGS